MFPDEQIAFGSVPAGATTEYQSGQNGVYSYAAYQATIDGERIMQGVTDWVGEQPLDGNACTCVLEIALQQPIGPITSGVQRD